MGLSATCQDTECPFEPAGACCVEGAPCSIVAEAKCKLTGGEYQGDDTDCLECPLFADANFDGTVGVPDMVLVVTNWGPCEGCPADVNADGMVDMVDLTLVLANWGEAG